MTPVMQVRVLIGDQNSVKFTDDEVQLFLDVSDESLFLAAALGCDAQASKIGANLKEQRLGDFSDSSGRNQVAALQAQALAYRKLEYETPAFAIAEQNLSDFNALIIIRNFVLRTNP